MTKWHSQKFIINGEKIDGLFDTTLDNILMSNYQHLKYKYEQRVEEYNNSVSKLLKTKMNIEVYFNNKLNNLEIKRKLFEKYEEAKKETKKIAIDVKFLKINYKLANRCYDIAKNKTGELFTENTAERCHL